jgi:CRISPR-associated endonuclease/helicase Cas3
MSLAKSDGLSLELHSQIVEKYATKLFTTIIDDEEFKFKYNEVVKYASLFHDIGKLTTNFQKFLNGGKKKPGYKFRHNEIGWAFLSKYLSDDFINYEIREIILNIVYWHHGISNKLQNHTDVEILSTLDDNSIQNMLTYLINCVGEDQINNTTDNTPNKSPLYFPEDKILKRNLHNINLLRSIVLTADRNGSNFNNINEVTDEVINNYLNMDNNVLVGNSKFDGTHRYELQKSIVDEIQEGKTTIVKAPAGFGKTLLGVLWGFKTNKKVIWVVPRNTIAKSLYKSILEEFNNLNVSTSVQLILSGEVVETNDPKLDMYQSNIIITNIDNYLAPNIKNNIMDSSGLLFGAKVIFDEYHELVTEAPLMALFINIMKARNLSTSASTLLLSATPINCNHLWELGKLNKSKETIILPNKETHYPAAHNKKYLLKTHNKLIIPKPNTNTLNIINTVAGAQNEKLNGDYTLLLHSNFTEEYKNQTLNTLLTEYGKKSMVETTKPNVIGTHILQASFDISFNNLYETVLSPQSTLQRIGRVNRWGELDYGTINIVKDIDNLTNKGDKSIKNILYNRNLSDRWFDYISKYNQQELTLNELYIIYNAYNNEANDVITDYVNNVYNISSTYLSTLYPYKFENNIDTSKLRMTAGSNKLRSVNHEIFYIVKHQLKDEWIGPFTKPIHNSYDTEFNEEGSTYNRMIKTMKKLRDNNDDRFNYNDILDSKTYGGTIDRLRIAAKKSDTPYIVYDRVYSDELGIIKIN